MDDIAIVGTGQTHYEKRKKDEIYADLVFDVTRMALDDAGLTIDDIDSVVTVSNDFFDGRTISGMAVGDASGGQDKNISTVEGDGAFGAFYGAMRVLGGNRTSLVVAHCKGSEGDIRYVTNGMFDPVFQRHLGLESVSSSALQARRYMDTFGVSEESLARISVKNHGNGRKNPLAHLPMDISVDDVMNSRKMAEPLKKLDCSPVSDGAAAVIIGNREIVEKAKSKPAWIRGIAHCADEYMIGDRELETPRALRQAADRAFAMAGINNRLEEVDVVELYDAFTYMEPLWLEGMGFCGPGEGMTLLEQGLTLAGGDLPVNPSGGVLSSHAALVAGLARVIEAALQVRGDAGKRQVEGARTAVAQGINGPCGQSHCLWVLSSVV